MRSILLDTNAYTAFKRECTDISEVIQTAEMIVMSPIVLGELLSGFCCGNREQKNRKELQDFLESFRVKVFPITADTAEIFSKIYTLLKKKGKPIPTNDIWIAAQALEHSCVICTYDAHFQIIEGLMIATTALELVL